jgi:hypothetical protein
MNGSVFLRKKLFLFLDIEVKQLVKDAPLKGEFVVVFEGIDAFAKRNQRK